MNKLIRDIWDAIKGAIVKVDKNLQARYKQMINDLKIKKYKEGRSVTLLSSSKEKAKEVKANYLRIIQDFFNLKNNSKYKFKVTYEGVKLLPIILPLVGSVLVLGGVGFTVYRCYQASLPPEKKLTITGGSTNLNGKPNTKGGDGKQWQIKLDNEDVTSGEITYSIIGEGQNPISEHIKVSDKGKVYWDKDITEGEYKFFVNVVYKNRDNQKEYTATSELITLTIAN